MIDFDTAIFELNPRVSLVRDGKAFDANGMPVEYDKAAVEKFLAENAYKTQRAKVYPSFADQFDALYHGGYDAWKAMIDEVKNKYPKP